MPLVRHFNRCFFFFSSFGLQSSSANKGVKTGNQFNMMSSLSLNLLNLSFATLNSENYILKHNFLYHCWSYTVSGCLNNLLHLRAGVIN